MGGSEDLKKKKKRGGIVIEVWRDGNSSLPPADLQKTAAFRSAFQTSQPHLPLMNPSRPEAQ